MISLEQKGRLLNKSAIFFLKISLDLTKLSEVRKACDQSNGIPQNNVYARLHFIRITIYVEVVYYF